MDHSKSKTVGAVLELILQGKTGTRNEIADRLGLSAMTVGNAVRMLRQAELVEEKEEPTPRGRYPFRLTPAERLHSVVVFLSPNIATVLIASATGDLLKRMTLPYQHSLPPEGNLASIRRACETCQREIGMTQAGLGVGVILSSDLPENTVFLSLLGQILHPDEVRREDPLIEETLSQAEYGRCVLYLSLKQSIRSMLLIGGEGTRPTTWTDPQDLLRTAAATVRLTLPDTVVIEAEGIYGTGEIFAGALTEMLPEELRGRIRLCATGELSAAEKGMRDLLCRGYAKRLYP